MQEEIGGADLLIDTDAEGAELVRRYLAYFLVERTDGTPSPTHDTIRSIVPDNRRGVYDMRRVIAALADDDSVFELRPNWAKAAITVARADGRPRRRHHRQPADVEHRRGHRQRRRRQAGPVHQPRRRLRPADRVADGQPRLHARTEGRARRHRPPPRPPADGPGPPHRAAVPRPRPQGLRARPDGDGRACSSRPTCASRGRRWRPAGWRWRGRRR